MPLEEAITTIVNQYGSILVSGCVVIVLTVFIMNMLKDFAINLVNFLRVKMSNLGYNTIIFWEHELYKVDEIKFTEIIIKDENKIIFIPIELWLKSAKNYPVPGINQFKEALWDGTERRHEDRRKN